MLSLGLEVSSEMSLGLPLSALSSHRLAPAALPALQAMFRVGDVTGNPLLNTALRDPGWEEGHHTPAKCQFVLPIAYQTHYLSVFLRVLICEMQIIMLPVSWASSRIK